MSETGLQKLTHYSMGRENRLNSRTVIFSAESKRTQAITLERIPTYFHYSLALTPRNKTHISSRITPINLGYRVSFVQR